MLILSVAALAIFGIALADGASVLLNPTTGGGGVYQLNNTGTPTEANVSQTVNLVLPQAYGIAIDDAATLSFDLGNLGTAASPNGQIVCVSGLLNTGKTIQDQQVGNGWWPLGTHYVADGQGFPFIDIEGGQQIFSYPPIAFSGAAGSAIDLTAKNDLVCYKSFILEKFTNVPGWTVTVSRQDADAVNNPLGKMFVQDNVCSTFGANTALQVLPDQSQNSPVDLFAGVTPTQIPALNTTTGKAAGDCAYGAPTSWLNDLVVLAIEVDGQSVGTSTSTLTYTIQQTSYE